MKKVVQQKQVVVAQAKQDCEELLVEIVQDKRVADEQEKQVRRLNPCCGCCAVATAHPSPSLAQRSTAQHSTAQHSTAQHSTAHV
jgi:hypothetical protein